MSPEGYVFFASGTEHPLAHALASLATLRRYDVQRPAALVCTPDAHAALGARSDRFAAVQTVETVDGEAFAARRFALDRFAAFERTLFVESDVLWCRDPAPLWQMLSVYAFTAAGCEKATVGFESATTLRGLWKAVRDRRRDEMHALGLTHLPRLSGGLAYVHDRALARRVGHDARCFAARFAEWSDEDALAAAMSRHHLPVLEARHGHLSPLLDYVDGLVLHDDAFEAVTVRYFVDPFVASLRTLQNPSRREQAFRALAGVVGRGDHLDVTPFALRFGSPDARARWDAFALRLAAQP